jgi:hypothetical protein
MKAQSQSNRLYTEQSCRALLLFFTTTYNTVLGPPVFAFNNYRWVLTWDIKSARNMMLTAELHLVLRLSHMETYLHRPDDGGSKDL